MFPLQLQNWTNLSICGQSHENVGLHPGATVTIIYMYDVILFVHNDYITRLNIS